MLFLYSVLWQQGLFTKIQSFWQMRPYEKQISACLKEKEAQLAPGERVIGLELDCALAIARPMYESNPTIALQICLDHQVFDLSDSLQTAACKMSLARRPAPSSMPISPPSPVATSPGISSQPLSSTTPDNQERLVYENTKYHYSFSYPQTARVSKLDDLPGDINAASSIAVFSAKDDFLFSIDALDPELLEGYTELADTIALRKEPLAKYVEFIQNKNIATNSIKPESAKIRIDGHEAYELWVTDIFHEITGSRTLEPREQAIFFTRPKDIIFQIDFPLGSPPSSVIFDSLKFN